MALLLQNDRLVGSSTRLGITIRQSRENYPKVQVPGYIDVELRTLERDALDMIKRRAKKAGLPDWIGNHVCRATGITRFLEAGGTLEEAANLANHADMRTTRIYDKRDRVIRRTSVERIVY